MGDSLKGIAVILGIGLVPILAVAFIHDHGPVKQPLSVTESQDAPRSANVSLCAHRHGRVCQFDYP
jgi:hypothetical protein